ncbi:tyrosine-type recombinase/integrase [Enterovirga sp. GCM10030262]|uniref:tyrosine-type recombinase/integrase n=1 Tax=Enterovirga sp. GCM10030262 TaxID=3273391 RepID=UPI00360C463D
MPRPHNKRHQIGNFWLWQRPGIGTWCICWLDHVDGRGVTRRKSIAARGGNPDAPPQQALDALAAHHLAHCTPRKEAKDEALVEALMADWLTHHVTTLAAPDRYVYSVQHWMAFFEEERRHGRIVSGPVVADLTPDLQARFRKARAAAGAGGHTISRDLAALRGALTWAWKHQRIDHPAFIADIPAHQKAPARDRLLAFEELARILDACADRPEREHIVRFIVIELGIAGRPEAVLGLTDANIDLRRNLIDPNQPGQVHTRKRRPIVPIAKAVRPWLVGIEGKLIKYKVPIAERHRTPGGPTHFERETASIKTSWNAVCRDAGVEGATPKTLRHTMLTWLAERGVPKEQREMLAGHRPQGTTSKNYEHLSPSYLRRAIREVDTFFDELSKHTKAHLRYTSDTRDDVPVAA